jgi:hypothetical protein
MGGCQGSLGIPSGCPTSYLLDVSNLLLAFEGTFEIGPILGSPTAPVDGGFDFGPSEFAWDVNGPEVPLTCSGSFPPTTAGYTASGTFPPYGGSDHGQCGDSAGYPGALWATEIISPGPTLLDVGTTPVGYVRDNGYRTSPPAPFAPLWNGWWAGSLFRRVESANLSAVPAVSVGGCHYLEQRLDVTIVHRAFGRTLGFVLSDDPPVADCVCFQHEVTIRLTRPFPCVQDSEACFGLGDFGAGVVVPGSPDGVVGTTEIITRSGLISSFSRFSCSVSPSDQADPGDGLSIAGVASLS